MKTEVEQLFEAVERDDCDTVRHLITSGLNVNSYDSQGCTPLIRAAILEKSDMAKLLLELGANLELRDSQEFTALMRASLFFGKDLREPANPVHYLLLQHGANKFATPEISEPDQVRVWLKNYSHVYGHKVFRLKSGERYEGFMKVHEEQDVITFLDPWSWDDDPEIPFDEIDMSSLSW